MYHSIHDISPIKTMNFSIKTVASDYVKRRFPRASMGEKEKVVADWVNKLRDSEALVADFKKRIGNPKDKKIIDVGCGSGGVSIAFAKAGALVSGIDIEKDLYEIAKAQAKSLDVPVDFFLYDGSKLPFSDSYFDYAVSVSVLEHTDNPVLYLEEIFRVLKPGGFLYLGFPNKLAFRETHTQLLFLTYLPAFLQSFYIRLFHRSPLIDNNLHFYGYFDLKKIITKVNKKTRDKYYCKLIEERGTTKNLIKKLIKNLLKNLGISYKVFLPHILVVLKKSA